MKRVEYRGPAVAVHAFAQMLREEGVDADFEAPRERRNASEIAATVVINILCNGAWKGIEVAATRFRASRFGPHAEITLFSSEDGEEE